MPAKPSFFPAACLALAASGWSAAADDGFERYEVILTRMPFGEVIVEEPPPAPPPPEDPSFAKALRMCSITKPEGRDIKVGIVDATTKKSFMLRVGENNADGIMLVSANLEEGEAVLQKGAQTALIKLEQTTAAAKPAAAAQRPADQRQQRASTYQERRQQRREERLARVRAAQEERERLAANQPKLTGQALRQHLQEYNMEAIRQGLPALPVELSPEQDAQLVSEGVLPPPAGAAPPGGGGEPGPGAGNQLPPELRDVLIQDLTEEELRMLQNY